MNKEANKRVLTIGVDAPRQPRRFRFCLFVGLMSALLACGDSDEEATATGPSASTGTGGQGAGAGETAGPGATGTGGGSTGGGNGAGGDVGSTCSAAQIEACEPFQPSMDEVPTVHEQCILSCNEGDACQNEECQFACQRSERQRSADCFMAEGCGTEAAEQAAFDPCFATFFSCRQQMACDPACTDALNMCPGGT